MLSKKQRDKIVSLRKDKTTFEEIAKQTECSISSAKKYWYEWTKQNVEESTGKGDPSVSSEAKGAVHANEFASFKKIMEDQIADLRSFLEKVIPSDSVSDRQNNPSNLKTISGPESPSVSTPDGAEGLHQDSVTLQRGEESEFTFNPDMLYKYYTSYLPYVMMYYQIYVEDCTNKGMEPANLSEWVNNTILSFHQSQIGPIQIISPPKPVPIAMRRIQDMGRIA